MSLKSDVIQFSAEELARLEEKFLINGVSSSPGWGRESGSEPAQFRALGAFSVPVRHGSAGKSGQP
jgi:hypothetical protein